MLYVEKKTMHFIVLAKRRLLNIMISYKHKIMYALSSLTQFLHFMQKCNITFGWPSIIFLIFFFKKIKYLRDKL